jgi:periplasmic protein TonB
VKAEYPQEARRLGLAGTVVMKVGIDRQGTIRSVRVLKRAGHGFDEAAAKAMWKFRFTPCRTHQGDTVDCAISYSYTFQDAR